MTGLKNRSSKETKDRSTEDKSEIKKKSSQKFNDKNDNIAKSSSINGEKIDNNIKEDKNENLDQIEDQQSKDEDHHHHHHHHDHHPHHKSKHKKKIHESRRVMFILGIVLGLILTVFFSTKSSFSADLEQFVNLDQLNNLFDDFKNWQNILPTSIQSYLRDVNDKSDDNLHGSADSFSVGIRLKSTKNFTSKYNVVMVPGVISTGLESWGTTTTGDCPSISYFRKRLWGSFFMLRTMILEKGCWLKHIQLDEETGLDPPNIKVRAAQGFEAADFFMAGYWIWNKILQNLAVIGYNPDNMISAAYDWRLLYIDLERRDGYFTKLRTHIELTYKMTGQKSVLVGHSMGSQVIFYFLKWLESHDKNWVDKYIESIVDISGSSLGTPKTIPALISGEMKDTVQLNALAVYGLEQFFSRRERVDMLRTFGGVASMIPKGGDLIWGNLTYAPDDPINTLQTENENNKRINQTIAKKPSTGSFGSFINYRKRDGTIEKHTIDDSIEHLLNNSPDWYAKRVRENYSFGIAKTEKELENNNNDQSKWTNPLEVALPNAPNLKWYCFYGVGNPTERSYKYIPADYNTTKLNYVIDPDAKDGVALGDGDGTVSLLTHTMCHEWAKGNKSRYNPGNVQVKIVEIKHEPDRFDLRGGAKTAEHVDILGSAELNELVLTVVSGNGDSIQDRFVSNLKEIVNKLDI
ncbi:unnamed protein product [Candida verbasci]|uniref:Phospholipid:diacylglycerol acyltransferase n=1 Tax=Candida verbasci TaxID=1227364 RepID=A0A9W4TYQ4_9ASCO|nr:unnamed protein product [Candida verbasci]